jgi:hypothetical protein
MTTGLITINTNELSTGDMLGQMMGQASRLPTDDRQDACPTE